MGTRADPAVEARSPKVEERSGAPVVLPACGPASGGRSMTPAALVALQRSAGNQAGLRALQSPPRGRPQRAPAGAAPPPATAPASPAAAVPGAGTGASPP